MTFLFYWLKMEQRGANILKRIVTDFVVSLLLFVLGLTMLVLPLFRIAKVDWILFGVLIVLAVLKLIQFIITVEDKNYESLYTCILSMLIGVLGMHFHLFAVPLKLAMSLLCWTTGMSLIKLKEADYYHDNKNMMWKFSLIELVIFIFVSIVASINLYHSPQIQMIVLGFFFLIYGILEVWNPIIGMLMKEAKVLHENSK